MLCHSRRCVNPVARKTCACGINPLRKGTAGTRRSGDCSFFCGEYRLAGDMAGGLAPRAEGARRRAPERRPDAEPCAARGVGRACRDGTARHRRYLAPRGGGAPQGMSVPAATFLRRRHPHPRGRLEAPSVTANGVGDCLCLDCPIGRSPCPRQMGRALSLDVRRSRSPRRFRVSSGRGSAERQGTRPDVKARRPVARTGRMDYGLKR